MSNRVFDDELEDHTSWNMEYMLETNDNIGRQVIKRFWVICILVWIPYLQNYVFVFWKSFRAYFITYESQKAFSALS